MVEHVSWIWRCCLTAVRHVVVSLGGCRMLTFVECWWRSGRLFRLRSHLEPHIQVVWVAFLKIWSVLLRLSWEDQISDFRMTKKERLQCERSPNWSYAATGLFYFFLLLPSNYALITIIGDNLSSQFLQTSTSPCSWTWSSFTSKSEFLKRFQAENHFPQTLTGHWSNNI